MPDFYDQFTGWLPTPDAEMDRISREFPGMLVTYQARGAVERKRTVAWEVLEGVGQTDQFWRFYQETGDCFVAGTPVTMADGSQKPIEQVQPGEFVITHTGKSQRVLATLAKPYEGELLHVRDESHTENTLWCTPDHKFYLRGVYSGEHWVRADELHKLGWEEQRRLGGLTWVENSTVYCLEVEEDHSFLAAGMPVSNCVSFGAAKAFMALEAYEIIRLGQPEKYHPLFPPYLYAISRCTPEGGNNRLRRRGAGSMGAWIAATIKYGVLRSDHPDCPKYSGALADQWGDDKGDWRKLIDIADDNQIKVMGRIENADQLADAICSGYFATIAGNRQFPQTLTIRNGKGWYVGGRRYGHQTSYLAFDLVDGEPCFYDSNQWPGHAGKQPDGPDGGGWRPWDYVDRELRSGAVECFAASQFDGFPSDDEKPDFSMGA